MLARHSLLTAKTGSFMKGKGGSCFVCAKTKVVSSSMSAASKPEIGTVEEAELRPVHVALDHESLDSPALQDWKAKLNGYATLKSGWNRYSAPAPSGLSLSSARKILMVAAQENLLPSRLAPSAVGGIGMTWQQEDREAYIEVYNNGTAWTIFSDDSGDEETAPVSLNASTLRKVMEAIRTYLS